MTAREMNGRYVRLNPSVAFHSFFTLLRATSTLCVVDLDDAERVRTRRLAQSPCGRR